MTLPYIKPGREEELTAIFATSSLIALVLDSRGKMIHFNDNLTRDTGYSTEELENKYFWKALIPSRHSDEVRKGLEGFKPRKLPRQFIIPLLTKNRKEMKSSWTFASLPPGRILALGTRLSLSQEGVSQPLVDTGLYQLIAENASDMISLLNPQGKILYTNRAHERVLGFTSRELLGRDVFELLHPQNSEHIKSEFLKSIKIGEDSGKIEARIRCENGEYRWIESHIRMVKQKLLHSKQALIVSSDITSRKKTEKVLITKKNKYRSLITDVLDTSDVAISIMNDNLEIVWINQAFERYFDISKKRAVGNGELEIIENHMKFAVEDYKKFRRKILSSHKQRSEVECFECHVLPGGNRSERWLEHWSQPIKSGLYVGGRIEHYYDITDRKRLEETLIESEERFRSFFDNAPIGVFRLAQEGNILMANKTLINMLGYDSFEELAAQHVKTSKKVTYPQIHFRELIKQYGEVQGYETGWIRPDGSLIFVRENIKPVTDGKGNIMYYEGTVENLTKLKSAEENLKRSEEKLKRIFDKLGDAVFVTSRDEQKGKILDANREASRQTGYSTEELLQMNVLTDLIVGKPSYDLDLIEKKIYRGEPVRFVEKKKRKDETVYTTEMTLVPTKYRGKRAILAISRLVAD